MWLDLGNNRLGGPLLETLGGLELLTALDLGGNQLEGSIPAALADLGQLTRLGLAGNRLEGSIPARLAGLVRLTVLALNGNRLTGVVPGLPFKQYTSYCALQAPTSPTNHFACPLPPVRQRRRAHVAAARAPLPMWPTQLLSSVYPCRDAIHPTVCPLLLNRRAPVAAPLRTRMH